MLRRRNRRDEGGQALVLAIGFVAVFAVIAASVLHYASTVEVQRGSTEKTASKNAVADGAAQFALSETAKFSCNDFSGVRVTGGAMQFPATIRGDTLQYATGGTSCSTVPGTGPTSGLDFIYLLGNLPSPLPSTVVLSVNKPLDIRPGKIDA